MSTSLDLVLITEGGPSAAVQLDSGCEGSHQYFLEGSAGLTRLVIAVKACYPPIWSPSVEARALLVGFDQYVAVVELHEKARVIGRHDLTTPIVFSIPIPNGWLVVCQADVARVLTNGRCSWIAATDHIEDCEVQESTVLVREMGGREVTLRLDDGALIETR